MVGSKTRARCEEIFATAGERRRNRARRIAANYGNRFFCYFGRRKNLWLVLSRGQNAGASHVVVAYDASDQKIVE